MSEEEWDGWDIKRFSRAVSEKLISELTKRGFFSQEQDDNKQDDLKQADSKQEDNLTSNGNVQMDDSHSEMDKCIQPMKEDNLKALEIIDQMEKLTKNPIEKSDDVRRFLSSLESDVKRQLLLELAQEPDVRVKYEVVEKMVLPTNDAEPRVKSVVKKLKVDSEDTINKTDLMDSSKTVGKEVENEENQMHNAVGEDKLLIEENDEMEKLFRQFLKFMNREIDNKQQAVAKNTSGEEQKSANEAIIDSLKEAGAVGGVAQEEPDDNGTRCPICFDRLDELLVTAISCGHVFCLNCTVGHLTTLINDGQIERFPCPGEGCDQNISLEIIGHILPLDILKRFEDLLLRRTLSTYDEVHDCPQCSQPIECAIDIGMGECPHCEFVFCTSCMRAYHGSYDCQLDEEDRRKLIDAFKREEAERARVIIEEARRRREAENKESNTFIKRNYKECPGCHKDIEKIEGCNHMICTCGTNFCYVCGGRMNALDPYAHFNAGSCKTFEYPDED